MHDSESLFKILLLGDSGVGKSCIILRYIEDTFSVNLMNSIGVDFKLKNIEINGKKVKLQIWDTAGQERFRTITTSYYKGAHAILIVYDITEKESFEHVKNWMADIDKFAKQGVLRVLVGNKSDLDHLRQVSKDAGNEMARKYGIKFIETSAKETINIEDLFRDTATTLLSKQINKPNMNANSISNEGLDLTKTQKQENNSGCC